METVLQEGHNKHQYNIVGISKNRDALCIVNICIILA